MVKYVLCIVTILLYWFGNFYFNGGYIFCYRQESKCYICFKLTDKFSLAERLKATEEFGGGIVVVKYVLCIVTILLLVVDAFIYFDLKKYIKVHENELVENHIKGLLGRAIAMTVISVCVGVIAIILQIM